MAERHGFSYTKTYNTWKSMIKRCTNKSHKSFGIYGGRGITVCERWRSSFISFLEDMGEKPNGLSLDRIDGNKGYYKENCRWATIHEQSNNRSTNVFLEFNGEVLTVAQWARKIGIRIDTLHHRLFKSGWTIERALTTKARTRKKRA